MTLYAPALIPAAALLAAMTVLLYASVHREAARGELSPAGRRRQRWARFLFYAQTALLEVAAAELMSNILTHRFDRDYIFAHSSTDLPFLYLVSTFWSGQEGTFLLWALYGSLFGCALIARSRDWEPTVLAVWGTLHLMVLGLLLTRSPFAPLDLAKFGPEDIRIFQASFGGVPPEGQGLNPLLQNPWMVIHPPVLFLGFAAMGLPFTFALAGLLRRDYDGWLVRAQGWTLLAWTVLGAGLVLGGYWAYETLGWGGYWAWDPVENSSLVPWLFAGALFHGAILQRQGRGALRRLNLLLACLAFGSVTYGSYLNRSGVLSDFSVHSFVALSPAFNRALLAFAIAPIALFLGLYLIAGPRLPKPALSGELLSRQRLLHIVVLLLAGSGVLVLIGNSWPLVSGLLSKTPGLKSLVTETSSLQQPFYNQTHTPLVMLMALMLGLVMATGWETARREKLLRAVRGPLLAAAAAAGVIAFALLTFLRNRAATPDWMAATAGPLVLVWGTALVLCVFAAAANGKVLYEEWRRGERLSLGTHLAHTGFMVLIIGVVTSSVYETKTILSLPLKQPVSFGGYELTYEGLHPVGVNAEIRVIARRGGRSELLTPLLRPGMDDQIIRNPGILKGWTHDLYLEPGEIKEGQQPEQIRLERQTPSKIGDLTIEFAGFDVGNEKMDPTNFKVGIDLEVTRAGKTARAKPWFVVKNGLLEPRPAPLPGGGEVAVVDIPAKDDGSGDRYIVLSLSGTGAKAEPETAVMQTTLKPAMSLVWLGCWMVTIGGLWAAVRRAGLARLLSTRASRTIEP